MRSGPAKWDKPVLVHIARRSDLRNPLHADDQLSLTPEVGYLDLLYWLGAIFGVREVEACAGVPLFALIAVAGKPAHFLE